MICLNPGEKQISDLREIIQSLETQVDSHCLKEAELIEQVEALSAALKTAQQQAQHLSSKVCMCLFYLVVVYKT